MDALLKILRAAHCHQTHQWFAVDALKLVQTDSGKRLARLLARYHDRYLTGAIDPDIRFRDFQNHVIHVNQGYWGGAPRVAHSWYDRMQRYLRSHRFADAAHAAGVLSHYFADVMQPLHTATGDREKILHAPIECSVSECYDEIYRGWQEDEMRVVFQLSHGVGWLGEAMLHGARFAHRKRNLLLSQYDLQAAAGDPRLGLNGQGKAALAEIFGLVITGLARLLERAAADAEAARDERLPTCSLVVPTLLAGVEAPLRYGVARNKQHARRAEVTQLIDEFRQTGSLQTHLPAEVDITHRVVQVYHDEQRWKQQRRRRLDSRSTVVEIQSVAPADDQHNQAPKTIPFAAHDGVPRRLSRHSPLAVSATIGPKTVDRFASIDIHTVGDLVDGSPQVLANRLGTYWITVKTVRQWQAEVTLMCEIAGLKASQAKWLVGSGYHEPAAIAAADPEKLHRDVSRFALTTSGRRCARGSQPPSLSVVTDWVAEALALSPASPPRRVPRRRAA
jgi:hypothetical protein